MKFLTRYKQAREDRLAGKINYVPFHESLPRLAKHFPGLTPNSYTIISAAKGVGKTKFAKFLTIYVPYLYKINNPDKQFDFTVIWNGLEESVEEFIDSFVVTRLHINYGINVTINELNGYSDKILDESVLHLIEESREYFEELKKHIIITDQANPYGFYKFVRRYCYSQGKLFDNQGKRIIIKDDNWKNVPPDYVYVKDNPNKTIVTVFDHLGLMTKEKGETWYESAEKLSGTYIRRMLAKTFHCANVLVQQRNAASQQTAYDYKGGNILDKIEPKITDLGKISITGDDALTVLMLFNPARYRLEQYEGYDIEKLEHNQRFLFITKNRRGKEGLILPLFFNGLTGEFKELPDPTDVQKMQAVYNRIALIS